MGILWMLIGVLTQPISRPTLLGLAGQLQYWGRQLEEIGLDFELVFAPLVIKQGECVVTLI